MPEHIMKRRAQLPVSNDELPRGLSAVLTEHAGGFFGDLDDDEPAHPPFGKSDIPAGIHTFEPWLGCLWGKRCGFCYVPNASVRHHPGGKQGYWHQEWGSWLLYKEDIAGRLRSELLDASGRTRSRYRGASIYMSNKTDPFLPLKETLDIACDVLDVIRDADVFLMCQTRSTAVVDDDRIFSRLRHLGSRRKIGVSFSIATDMQEEQNRIEAGGPVPEKRLAVMSALKGAGLFVSAAVSPLMPFSPRFAERLIEASHHASVQLAKPSGAGASTPKTCLATIESIPGYARLGTLLCQQLSDLGHASRYAWGVGNKGFIGAFIAARRFYVECCGGGTPADSHESETSLQSIIA